MDSKMWFFFLLGLAVITSLLCVARIVLGIMTVSRTHGHVENRFGISLILSGISGVLSAFLNNQLYIRAADAFSTYGSIDPSVISMISTFTMLFSLMGFAASFIEADYCYRKYGARIRLLFVILIVINSVVSFLAGYLITFLTDRYALTSVQAAELTGVASLISFAPGVLFLVTFIRYRKKENVFRNIYIFSILSVAASFITIMLRLITSAPIFLYASSQMPSIMVELIMFSFSVIGPARAFYIFHCVNKAKNEGLFDKTDAITEKGVSI